MAFIGKALIAIWNDIAEESRADFIEWQNREHLLERLSIPGFISGHRYKAINGTPEYFTLYELDSIASATGPAYQERLKNPTEWTQRALKAHKNLSRAVCEIVFSRGAGRGGFLRAIRFAARAGSADDMRRYLVEVALPSLEKIPTVTGAHLGVADASNIRPDVPPWMIFVEATAATGADKAGEQVEHGLAAAALCEGIKSGCYSLEFTCRPGDIT